MSKKEADVIQLEIVELFKRQVDDYVQERLIWAPNRDTFTDHLYTHFWVRYLDKPEELFDSCVTELIIPTIHTVIECYSYDMWEVFTIGDDLFLLHLGDYRIAKYNECVQEGIIKEDF